MFHAFRLTLSAAGGCAAYGKEVYLSLHAHEFEGTCTGTGKVWRVKLPWCPRCEREPETYGCVHQNLISDTKDRPEAVN